MSEVAFHLNDEDRRLLASYQLSAVPREGELVKICMPPPTGCPFFVVRSVRHILRENRVVCLVEMWES